MSSDLVACAVWGFLVGFVCWGALFRLAEPVADWLVSTSANRETLRGIARWLVLMVAILGTLLLLAAAPMLLADLKDASPWKRLFGTSYVASLAGYFGSGWLRKRRSAR